MNPDVFFENFEMLAEAPNGIQKLRELILQFAVMGKLVPQNPDDEPASIMLKQIKCEKEGLIEEKKIQNVKCESSYRKPEIFCNLPTNWEVTSIGEITNIVRGVTFHSSAKYTEKTSGTVLCIRTANVQEQIELTDAIYIPTEYVKRDEQWVQEKDIVISMANSKELVGKVALVNSIKERCTFGGFLSVIRPIVIDPFYLFWTLRSPLIIESIREMSSQTVNIANISLKKLRPIPIPIPPLAEQKRIVTKVDELMALCDQLEARQQKKKQLRSKLNSAALDKMLSAESQDEFEENWRRICENFDLLYDNPENVEELRKAVLQLAIQGKLVEQDERDEPASVLIEKIKNERKKLVKNGKIRGSKPTKPINPEELPFTLPENWVWCKVEQIADVRIGSTPSRKESSYWDGDISWVSSGEVANCRISATREHITDLGLKNSSTKIYPKRTVLIAMIGQGKTRGQSAILDIEACTNQNVAGLIFNAGNIYPEYVWRWALSEYEKTRSEGRGGAQPALNGNKVRELLIPLPPLNEQKRIVEKVEQLMDLCDELEGKLRKEREESKRLMEAVARGLIEGAAAEI